VIGATCVAGPNYDQRLAHTANILVGGVFNVQSGGRVTAIGIDTSFQNVVQHVNLAIYAAGADGGPATLIAAAYGVIITGGTVEATIAHTATNYTELPAGLYWIMAVSDQALFLETCPGSTMWALGPLDFSAPLPPTLPTPETGITKESLTVAPSLYFRLAHPQ
jgi:hypothetical protein